MGTPLIPVKRGEVRGPPNRRTEHVVWVAPTTAPVCATHTVTGYTTGKCTYVGLTA